MREMLDAVESGLPGHVEEMEFQVSFSGLRCATAVLEQPEKVDSFGLMWMWSRWARSPRCAAREKRFPAGCTVSGRDGCSNDSIAGRERTAMAKTFTTARAVHLWALFSFFFLLFFLPFFVSLTFYFFIFLIFCSFLHFLIF